MIGYNLYLVETWTDPQTGKVVVEDDPYFLRLSYGSLREAEDAKKILETVYTPGSIEISVKANNGTFVPGEGE